jgi:hypothetical protein
MGGIVSIYRVLHRGDGFECYEVEADSEYEARMIVADGSFFPVQTYIEGAEFDSVEVIEP